MKATHMFKALGYRCKRRDDDYVIYEKSIDGGQNKKVVDFCEQNRNVNVHYDFQHGEQVPSIDMQLFKAIQKQLEELGWLED